MSIERGVCRGKLMLNSTANTWATFHGTGGGGEAEETTRLNTGLLVAKVCEGKLEKKRGGLKFYPKELLGGQSQRERELRW